VRAILQHGIRDIRVEERPDPAAGAGEVLLRVQAVTICASDVHIYAEGNVGGVAWDRPFIPGHEASAIIAGPEEADPAPGTTVVLDPALPCRACAPCSAGNFHLCANLKFCDLPPLDGTMRELMAWPADRVFPIPPAVPAVEAPLIEPLAVAVHAVELAEAVKGTTVAVAGCGAIGLLTLQVAKARGARAVFATDPIPARLSVARELGADDVVEVGAGDPVAELGRLTGGRGVDIAFEAAGPPEALAQCLEAVRPGGQVVVIGIPSVDEYRMRASQLRRRELTLRFVRRQNENYPEAIGLVRDGLVALSPILTHRFPPERVGEAFALAERKHQGAIRVAVTFS